MQLPKQDHYEIARDAALSRLQRGMERDRLGVLGARLAEDGAIVDLQALCWQLRVRTQPFSMHLLPGGQEVSLPWQILALDYLAAETPIAPTGFVSFADLVAGRSYLPAFQSRVTDRLSHTVGRDGAAFRDAVERLGATPVEGDPVRCILRFFPLVEFQVVRYEGDEEFAPSCNVLFSDNVLSILSLEDGIVAAERMVAALEGKTPAARKGS